MTVTVSAKNTNGAYLKNNIHAWVEYFECNKTDECPLYAEGKCACFRYLIGAPLCCPNASFHRLEGPTKRAKSFLDFRDRVTREFAPTAKEFKDKVAVVADYIFVPMAVGSLLLTNAIDEAVNGHFVPVDKFNADMVEAIVTFRPRSIMGSTGDYQKEEVPKFVQQLKEEMPVVYEQWMNKYPDTANKFQDVSPIGRTAYISTLADGSKVKIDYCGIHGTFTKKGNILECDEIRGVEVLGARNISASMIVEISEDMIIKFTETMIADENTKFVD